MKAEFEYKGYVGSAEVDAESMVLVGRLLFITDVIAYSAESVAGLEQAFKEAVDEYLATCKELGDEPDVPCKGSFNVRVGPERHRQAVLRARKEKVSLNDFVCRVIDRACDGSRSVNHTHLTLHLAAPESLATVASSTQTLSWHDVRQYEHVKH